MKSFLITTCLAALALLSACEKVITPSGNVVQRTVSVPDYTAVDVSGTFKAYVSFVPGGGDIVLEADDNIQEFIRVKVTGNRLYIGMENGFQTDVPATLKAYVPANGPLNGLFASGASEIALEDTCVTTHLHMEASGASRISGVVQTNTLAVDLSGASNADLAGAADQTQYRLSGASGLYGLELVISNLVADLSGASQASAFVAGNLFVKASGASTLRYKGAGVVQDQDLSGGSQIIHLP